MWNYSVYVISVILFVYLNYLLFLFIAGFIGAGRTYSLSRWIDFSDSRACWDEITRAAYNVNEIDEKLTYNINHLRRTYMRYLSKNPRKIKIYKQETKKVRSYDIGRKHGEEELESFHAVLIGIFVTEKKLHEITLEIMLNIKQFGIHHKLEYKSHEKIDEKVNNGNDQYQEPDSKSGNNDEEDRELIEIYKMDEIVTKIAKELGQEIKRLRVVLKRCKNITD